MSTGVLLHGLGSLLLIIQETDEISLVAEVKWCNHSIEVLVDLLVQLLHVVEIPLLLKLII